MKPVLLHRSLTCSLEGIKGLEAVEMSVSVNEDRLTEGLEN